MVTGDEIRYFIIQGLNLHPEKPLCSTFEVPTASGAKTKRNCHWTPLVGIAIGRAVHSGYPSSNAKVLQVDIVHLQYPKLLCRHTNSCADTEGFGSRGPRFQFLSNCPRNAVIFGVRVLGPPQKTGPFGDKIATFCPDSHGDFTAPRPPYPHAALVIWRS
ncbi:hypothetical protein F2P81_018456 [Scophthalmus maximus]|uniref:Uncharacterized protein n=1 Tax=Scophthalmus maximus TaxID=52904 RepID=A0A6A4SE01_SCOMX|nr:hypothetical protein F2P81_018456 [Scophthalmus maximus]